MARQKGIIKLDGTIGGITYLLLYFSSLQLSKKGNTALSQKKLKPCGTLVHTVA